MFCGIGGFHLRSSTVPQAQHDRRAQDHQRAERGALDRADVLAQQQRHPDHAEREPAALRFDSGSCSTSVAMNVAHSGIV